MMAFEFQGRRRPTFHVRPLSALGLLFLLHTPGQALAQDPPAAPAGIIEPEVDNDEPIAPDVTDRVDLVEHGTIQIEFGGIYARSGPAAQDGGMPIAARIGLTPRLELFLRDDGLVYSAGGGATATGVGNLQVGGKFDLVPGDDDRLGVALLPIVTLPAPGADRGLGASRTGISLAVMSGTDFRRTHVDVTYGIGRVGAASTDVRLTQHVAGASASLEVPGPVTPMLAGMWTSRIDPAGRTIASVEAGVVYQFSGRYAADLGIQRGLTREAPTLAVHWGLSAVVGELPSGHGAYARMRRLAALLRKRRPVQ